MKYLEESLIELRETFKSGKTKTLVWRKKQLKALITLIEENEDKIFRALYEDLGKHPTEAYRDEVGVILKSAEHCLNNVENWMSPEKKTVPLVFFPATGQVVPEPLGVILIFSCWNFPICESFESI